jgi:hypothetical protein
LSSRFSLSGTKATNRPLQLGAVLPACNMAEGGQHGGGVWALPLSRDRVGNINSWLAKAPGATHAPLSRHWQGPDMMKPVAQPGLGRKETDVRGGNYGCTPHYPDSGQLSVQRAARGSHQWTIHGDRSQPANVVIYEMPSAPNRTVGEPPPREEGPCIYLGDKPSRADWGAGLMRTDVGRSGWRIGDRERFTFDGSVPPPAASATSSGGGPGRKSPAKLLISGDPQLPAESSEAAVDLGFAPQSPFDKPIRRRPDQIEKKLSDIHEGWQGPLTGVHRPLPDPPRPRERAFCRSQSDVTLQSGGAAARAQARGRDRVVGGEIGASGHIDFEQPYLGGDGVANVIGALQHSGSSGVLPGQVSYGRRQTSVTTLKAPTQQGSPPGAKLQNMDKDYAAGMLTNESLGAEIAASNPAKEGAAFGHIQSDLHRSSLERPFRQLEGQAQMEPEASGRPKYGRRRYPLTLFPADYDLLQI